MNQVAQTYKDKVTVIGVNVREGDKGHNAETEEMRKRAAEFADKKMQFPVCMDTPEWVVYQDWLIAAGMKSIPTMIIVDQQGKIAWIGHGDAVDNPFDTALNELLAGTYDYKKAAASFRSDMAPGNGGRDEKKQRAAMQALMQPMQEKNYDAVLAKAAELCAADPENEKYVLTYRVVALAHTDVAKALELAKTATGMDRLGIAASFAMEEKLPKPLYEFAVAALAQVPDSDSSAFLWRGFLAQIYYRLGDRKKAMEVQQQVLDQVKDMGDSHTLEEAQKAMDKYKGK